MAEKTPKAGLHQLVEMQSLQLPFTPVGRTRQSHNIFQAVGLFRVERCLTQVVTRWSDSRRRTSSATSIIASRSAGKRDWHEPMIRRCALSHATQRSPPHDGDLQTSNTLSSPRGIRGLLETRICQRKPFFRQGAVGARAGVLAAGRATVAQPHCSLPLDELHHVFGTVIGMTSKAQRRHTNSEGRGRWRRCRTPWPKTLGVFVPLSWRLEFTW